MNFTVRAMQKEDIPRVQDIARITWNATYEGIIPLSIQEKFLDAAYQDEQLEQRLKHSILYVAEVNDQVVGFVNYSPVKENGVVGLGAIYIHPHYQGKGIGSAMLTKGIREIDGVKEIMVEVEKDNLSGLQFYQAKSFEVVREFDDHFDGHLLKTIELALKI